jgi:hypothetical protein
MLDPPDHHITENLLDIQSQGSDTEERAVQGTEGMIRKVEDWDRA